MKKITNIIVIVVLAFALNFAIPSKKAEAFVWAAGVPAGITVGAGTYYVGALALAGLVGIAGYDTYSEEINAHAQRAWENGTQLSKDSLNAMINASKGLGSQLTATDSNFNDWMSTQLDSLGELVANLQEPQAVSQTNNYTVFKSIDYLSMQMTGTLNAVYGPNQSYDGPNITFEIYPDGRLTKVSSSSSMTLYTGLSDEQLKARLAGITTPFQMAQLWNAYIHTSGSYSTWVMKITVADTAWNNAYNTGVSKVTEAWEDMRDAGLVLPVDSAIPTYQNNPVNYNEQTDTYTGVDGGVINPSDLTWNFPKPRIRDGTETDVPAPLAPGVYVDTPPITGNPAIDGAGATTTTNVFTGATTTTNVGTGTGDGGTSPPKENTGDPINPFKNKPIPVAALLSLFQLLAALIFYLLRMFAFILTLSFIEPTIIDNPTFQWFKTLTILGITPYPLVINLAIFFLGFSIYKSVRRVFG